MHSRRLIVLAAFALLSCTLRHGAALALSANATEARDPQAMEVFDAFCHALREMPAFSVEADILTDTVYEDGSKIQYGRHSTVKLRRPNAFAGETVGDDYTYSSVFNGETLTVLLPKKKEYGQLAANMDTDELLDMLYTEYGMDTPMGDLFKNAVCEDLKADEVYYVGLATVEGASAHHLFFRNDSVDWQLWIDAGKKPLLRKLVITEKTQEQAPQFMATFRNWSEAAIPDETFVFKAPDGYAMNDAMFSNATK